MLLTLSTIKDQTTKELLPKSFALMLTFEFLSLEKKFSGWLQRRRILRLLSGGELISICMRTSERVE